MKGCCGLNAPQELSECAKKPRQSPTVGKRLLHPTFTEQEEVEPGIPMGPSEGQQTTYTLQPCTFLGSTGAWHLHFSVERSTVYLIALKSFGRDETPKSTVH